MPARVNLFSVRPQAPDIPFTLVQDLAVTAATNSTVETNKRNIVRDVMDLLLEMKSYCNVR